MGVKKKCNSCEQIKPIGKFYVQKTGLMGRTGSCKACRLEKQKKYSEKNREQIREKAKKYRQENKDKISQKNKRFKEKNPDYWKEYYRQNTEKRIEANKRFLHKNPERKKLYQEYRSAISRGILKKPEDCSVCGKQGKIVGHHPNYEQPLRVTWVCKDCHFEIHRKHSFTK